MRILPDDPVLVLARLDLAFGSAGPGRAAQFQMQFGLSIGNRNTIDQALYLLIVVRQAHDMRADQVRGTG